MDLNFEILRRKLFRFCLPSLEMSGQRAQQTVDMRAASGTSVLQQLPLQAAGPRVGGV